MVPEKFILPVMFFLALAVLVAAANVSISLGYHPISQITRPGSLGNIDSDGNGWPDKCDTEPGPEYVYHWAYGPTVTCGAGQPPTCPSFTPDCSANLGQECDTPGQQSPCEFLYVQWTEGPGSLGFCQG